MDNINIKDQNKKSLKSKKSKKSIKVDKEGKDARVAKNVSLDNWDSKDYIEVKSGPLDKILAVPSSKSYTNRLLILGAICSAPVRIENYSKSTDSLHLINSLKKMGIRIDRGTHSLIVQDSFPLCEDLNKINEVVDIHPGEGGTTNRFLIALCSKGKRKYRIHAEGKMPLRPMEELYQVLSEDLGVKLEATRGRAFPVEVQGPPIFSKRKIAVDCRRSSQFLSALSLAFADSRVEFHPVNLNSSWAYYELTLNLIKLYHFEFSKRNLHFKVPVDFSSMSYPTALALLTGQVIISNCQFVDMLQADSIFLKIIRKMGGDFRFTAQGLKVQKARGLKGIDWDCSPCPDLVPTLAFICSYAEGTSVLSGLDVLDYKESERNKEICSILRTFEVDHDFDDQRKTLTIRGPSMKVGRKEFKVASDHRMLMLAYIFLRYNSGGRLYNDLHTVDKSFDNFFEVME